MIIGGGLLVLRHEPRAASWRDRLWLHRPSGQDWARGAAAVAILVAASGAAFAGCAALGLDPNPPFARGLQPWSMDRIWVVALWLVYWP